MQKNMINVRRLASGLAVAAFFAGCAVAPHPFKDSDQAERSRKDLQRLTEAAEPVTAPVTLQEATARAVKYNMDYRQRLMEQVAALGQLDVGNWDLLPKLTLQAGYTSRDNDAFSFGVQPNGVITTSPSTAVERTHLTDSAVFSWNILDFGLSYFRAKQLADQSLIAEERRRRALQNLTQDVRFAWWRAESAERLVPEIDAFLREIDLAAGRAKLIETRRLLPPIQIIAYRRSLLDLAQQLTLRRQELVQSKIELAALMNLPPGAQYQVAVEPLARDVPDLKANIDVLENLALINRPELREESYRRRVTDLEHVRSQWAVLVPGAGIDAGYYNDTNKYLVNNSWEQAGLSVAFNLVKVFSLPAINRSFEAQKAVDDTRRLAVSSAVLTQTRIAAVRFGLLKNEYAVWDEALRDDQQIIKYLQSANQTGLETELEIIRASARLLITKINRDLVYSGLQAAMGRVYHSVGLDSLPAATSSLATASIGSELAARIAAFEKENFTASVVPEMRAVEIAGPQGVPPAGLDAFRSAMQRALTIARIPVASEKAAARVETSLEMGPSTDNSQAVKMKVRLVDAAGKTLLEAEQKSVLLEPIDNLQWAALGEGAGYRVTAPLQRYLGQPAIVR
jgi:outer membrane protein TolC